MPAATISLASSRSNHREWTPTDREQLIFRWVKFEGRTQGWVAEQLSIHQSTVSRIVERYEKWIAHGGPGRQGALNHDERLRAQRWLTYERNEWIVSAALRMAAELEQPCEASRSTVSRSAASPSQETEIRTQHLTVDRSGSVARYLRLAHRVYMENLELVEEEPLPPLEPLTIDDMSEPEESHLPALAEIPAEPAAMEALAATLDLAAAEQRRASQDQSAGNATPGAHDRPGEEPLPMQPMHSRAGGELQSTSDTANGYDENTDVEKPPTTAYPGGANPPEMINSWPVSSDLITAGGGLCAHRA